MNETILQHPNPALRQIAEPIKDDEFGTKELKEITTAMTMVMMKHNGLGLAAPQIGINKRIFVRVCQKDGGIKAYCNPEFETDGDEIFSFKEGCLSVPNVFGVVRRPMHIIVKARDIQGEEFEESLSRLESTCVQHEIDHLEGIEFIDYLSDYQKQKILQGLSRLKIKSPSEYNKVKRVIYDEQQRPECAS